MISEWAIRAIAEERCAEVEREMRSVRSMTGARPLREKAQQARARVGMLLAIERHPSSRQRHRLGAPTSG
jgi:hypothetical protein